MAGNRRWGKGLALGAALAGLAWWVSAGGRFSEEGQAGPRDHHGDGEFHNRYGGDIGKGSWEVLKWQFSRKSPPLPDPPLPRGQFERDAALPNVTWIGHATALVRTQSLTVLTDPHFSERASPVSWAGPKRLQPPGVALADLPRVDVVLISHNHYDHLDQASVLALSRQAGGSPLFLVPLGVKAWFESLGITHVRELDWWQEAEVKGVQLALVPVHHWSARGVLDRRQSLWGGFAIFDPQMDWVFTGDTGYAPDFKEIRARYDTRIGGGFDFALLPVGCYEPRDFMKQQHVNPSDAVQVFEDFAARQAVGVHWGTFVDLCDEPLDQAPKDLATALKARGIEASRFRVLPHGGTWALEGKAGRAQASAASATPASGAAPAP